MRVRRGRQQRGAIVGFGNAAVKAHLPVWSKGSGYQIVAVVDNAPERLDQAKALMPQIRCYASPGELLEAEKIDFVDVSTPPASHAGIIAEASAHSLHVLCEKPLALTAEDSAAIAAAARTTGVVIYTVDNWKHAPLLRTVRRFLTRGEIGHVHRVELRTLRYQPPRGATAEEKTWRLDPQLAGGGIAIDHGWHAFYLLQFLIGKQPLEISAKLERRKFVDFAVEDTAAIEVTFPGASASVFLTWAADKRQNLGRVIGDRGEIEMLDDKLVVRTEGQEPQTVAFSQPISASSYHPDWFEPMLADFRQEIMDSETRGGNLREALTCMALTLATYRSHELGGVPVPVFPQPDESLESAGANET